MISIIDMCFQKQYKWFGSKQLEGKLYVDLCCRRISMKGREVWLQLCMALVRLLCTGLASFARGGYTCDKGSTMKVHPIDFCDVRFVWWMEINQTRDFFFWFWKNKSDRIEMCKIAGMSRTRHYSLNIL